MHKSILLVIWLTISLSVFSQHPAVVSYESKVMGNCEMCKTTIEKTALKHGSKHAEWDINTHVLKFSIDTTKKSKSDILSKIAAVGYDNELFKAPDAIFKKLPPCCHYTRDGDDPAHERKNTTIHGVVMEENNKGKMSPLAYVTITDVHTGLAVQTNADGVFELKTMIPAYLSLSHVGYSKDSISVTNEDLLTILLKPDAQNSLGEVIVSSTRNRYVSTSSITNNLTLGLKELSKAACCNLSESFETSPSVDVSYADAVTGLKQIQLLGLSGNYTQLLTENANELRGLAGNTGLTYIPGPWIESIQLTKGVGSVVNGYESIAGQINVEEKKPDAASPLHLNAYINSMGRAEGNIVAAKKINENWSTSLLAHGNGVFSKNDMNDDHFLDIPLGRQINIINRWKYSNANGWIVQLALKAVDDKRTGGQMGYDKKTDRLTTHHYGVELNTAQYAATAKVGYVFPRHKYKSIGVIVTANQYSNNGTYGLRTYTGKQKTVNGNIIYQSIIGNTNHKFRTGVNFVTDNYNETFEAFNYRRNEIVPGGFFEYTWTATPKLSVIAGFRGDYHNLYGFISTPRIHAKYDFSNNTILRLAAGTGFKVANIFAENASALVSARQFMIDNPANRYGYGLAPEKAFNTGLNFLHKFKMNNKEANFSIDVYHTRFNNQTVADYDAHPQQLHFYNLDGKSFANSIQTEVNLVPFAHFETRLGYRWLDVQTDYASGRMEKPLVAKHRAFSNFAYNLKDKWHFDYTLQWISKKRLPGTASNPANLQMPGYAPSFIQMAAQVTRKFKNNWDLYIGGENLTGYRQKQLFIDAANPFGNYFDGSMVWGPVVGRMIYAGFRYNL